MANSIKGEQPPGVWRPLLWGFLAGLGLWVFGLTLVFSVSMGIFLIIRMLKSSPSGEKSFLRFSHLKNLGLIFVGGLLGASPWWVYAAQNGVSQLINELGGSAVAVEQSHWLLIVGRHFTNLILFGSTAAFGMRPSWEIHWLGLPLLPVALTFWMGVLIYILGRFRNGQGNRFGAGVLVGTMLILSLGFIFTPFGVDPSGRYFLPFAIPLALFAAEMVLFLVERYGHWSWGLIAIILAYNFWGIWQTSNRYPPGITTQFNTITQVDHRAMDQLIEFLSEQAETTGYTNYWVSYPLAFLSDEELIFIPRLPYHEDFRYTSRDDRYEPYDKIVEQSSRVAYITTHHPDLNRALRDKFSAAGATWQEKEIGDYFVFYDLSKLIRPEQIGLGLSSENR